jgi:cytoskeletal protein CcmA (bactofilin family)
MFTKTSDDKKSKTNQVETSSHNIIAAGTTFKGSLTVEGNIRIDGTLMGDISTKGKLVLGETGKIEGEIECTNAVISGNLKGKIVVHELLSLKTTSLVDGDVFYGKIEVDQGAKINGTLLIHPTNTKNTNISGASSQKTKSVSESVLINN